MAPITANTPLPPLTPLPLASQPDAGNAASQPPPGASPLRTDQPTLPPLPPSTYYAQPPSAEAAPQQQSPGGAPSPAINSTWATYTTFALVYTSLILLTAIAIAYDAITKSGGLLVTVFIIIIIVNIIYPLIVFRPGWIRSMRSLFTPSRRGP